jgi:tetratricopeptide (TPR) repeat protein
MHRLRGRADHRNRLRIDLLESVVAGDSPGLVRAASALVDLYPENRFYTYLLGRGYYMTGQFQRCLQTLRPLADQHYEWAWTYALAARSAMHLGDAAEARRLFESGLEVTRDPELGYAYVRFLRQQGDLERVRAVIEEGLRSPIIAESPVAEGELRVELAKELIARGDRERARAEIGRALVLLPRTDEAWPEADSLARALGPE